MRLILSPCDVNRCDAFERTVKVFPVFFSSFLTSILNSASGFFPQDEGVFAVGATIIPRGALSFVSQHL